MPPRIQQVCLAVRLLAAASCIVMPGRQTWGAPAPAKTPAHEGSSAPRISIESLPALLQRGTQAFAAGDFAQAADAFRRVEAEFGGEAAWRTGNLPRRLLPLRGFAALRAGSPADASEDLAGFLERFPDEFGSRGFALYALALALHQAGRTDESLARFAQYEAEHPGTAQATLATLQRAEICFDAGRVDEGFALLESVRQAGETAESLRMQARLRALEKAVEHRRDGLATELLFSDTWTVTTMPEIGVLAFAALESGDRLLAAGKPAEAVRAFRLVPPKARLVAAQRARLDDLRRVFAERAPQAGSGSGLFWVDYYRARIQRIEAQLAALDGAEDYTPALRLRLGQALLLDGRPREAWLCFESVATWRGNPDTLRQDAHYRWILAAADLRAWSDALVIARGYTGAFPTSELAPEAFFLIVRAHLEQQEFSQAEIVLTDILERFPGHPAAVRSRFTRGWLRTLAENYGAAREDFAACESAAAGTPLAVQAGLWRGLTHHFAREREEALRIFDALARQHPDDPLLPEILYRRGATLYAMRDLGRARREMELFISTYRMHPRHAEALVLLGDILMGEGELDTARQRFADVPPEAVNAHVYAAFQIGKILRAQGDHAALVEHFTGYARRAADRALPRVSEALYHLGWAREQLGEPEAALPIYAEALARFGDDPDAGEVGATLAALHKLSRRLGRSPAATRPGDAGSLDRLVDGDFETWLRQEREQSMQDGRWTYHARLTLALADLHLARKEPAQAELLVLELAGGAPLEALDATALARVGAALLEIGSLEAGTCFQQLLRSYPHHPDRAVAFHGLAALARDAREPDEALRWVERFEHETPAHPLASRIALLAGEVLERSGHRTEAVRRFDSVLRLKQARGRPHAIALAGLARCAQAEGDLPRAIAYHQRIYTLHRAQPDLAAEAYLESAPLFERLGDLDAAVATYRELLASRDIGDAAQRERAHHALEALEQRLPASPAMSGPTASGT